MINKHIENLENELKRQIEKWGIKDHPSTTSGRNIEKDRIHNYYEIPSEERAKYLLGKAEKEGNLSWSHIAIEELSEAIAEPDPSKRYEEVCQLACVCLNWMDSIFRKEIPDSEKEFNQNTNNNLPLEPNC
jgi:hypothetical protein